MCVCEYTFSSTLTFLRKTINFNGFVQGPMTKKKVKGKEKNNAICSNMDWLRDYHTK